MFEKKKSNTMDIKINGVREGIPKKVSARKIRNYHQ